CTARTARDAPVPAQRQPFPGRGRDPDGRDRQRRIAVSGTPAVRHGRRRLRLLMAVIRRYNRRTRWLHAGVYVTVLILLATGWWLVLGQEGEPSPLARITG